MPTVRIFGRKRKARAVFGSWAVTAYGVEYLHGYYPIARQTIIRFTNEDIIEDVLDHGRDHTGEYAVTGLADALNYARQHRAK